MPDLLQRGSNGLRRRGANGMRLKSRDSGECCCGTGTYVTLSFSEVDIDQIPGAYYWLQCGDLNGREFIINTDSATMLAYPPGSFPAGDFGAVEGTEFSGISIDAQGETTLSNDPGAFVYPFSIITLYLGVAKNEDGDWEIVVTADLSVDPFGLAPTAVIFRGTAPFTADGSDTTASNLAGGWTGDPISGTDIEGGHDIGNGGTATLKFYQSISPQTDDGNCLCDGVVRSEDCIDLVAVRTVTSTPTTSYDIIEAHEIIAGHRVDPVTYEITYVFYAKSSTFIRTRSDCCTVAGSYTAVAGSTDTVDVLLAANVEAAHATLAVTGGPIAFDLTRRTPNAAQFVGSAGGYGMNVYLDGTGGTLTWRMVVEQGGGPVLTAQLPTFSAGGTSFAGAYDVLTSTIPGILVGDDVTVTT